MRCRNSYHCLMFILGVVGCLGGSIVFLAIFCVQEELLWKAFFLTFASLSIFCGYTIARRCLRISCSYFVISLHGVENMFCNNVIRIRWEECEEIGIGAFPIGGGRHGACIYFSKIVVPQKQIYKINGKVSSDKLWIEYTDEVWAEVLKYVPEEKIRNKHLLPTRRGINTLYNKKP